MEYPKLLKYVLEMFDKEVAEFGAIGSYSVESTQMYFLLSPPPEPNQKNVPFDLATVAAEKDIVKREILIFLVFSGLIQALSPGSPKIDVVERIKGINSEDGPVKFKANDEFALANKRRYQCFFKTSSSKKEV